MKRYSLRKTDSPSFGYVVFATSYESPFDDSREIERYLAKKGYSGHVVFAVLLSTGVRESRFLAAPFDGKALSLSDVSPVHDSALVNIAAQFYKDNFQKVDTTILAKPFRFKLRKGLPI